jgi:hypothetical protein
MKPKKVIKITITQTKEGIATTTGIDKVVGKCTTYEALGILLDVAKTLYEEIYKNNYSK